MMDVDTSEHTYGIKNITRYALLHRSVFLLSSSATHRPSTMHTKVEMA